MKKCKWAGDAGDEYCKSCDGITMMVDGNSISCEECAGYEEGTEEVTTETEEKVEESKEEKPPINPPVEETEEVKEEPKKEEPVKPKKSADKQKDKKEVVKSTKKDEKVVETQNTTSESAPKGVNVLALRYMSGVTICHNDTYYKFSAEEEWGLDLNIFNTTEKIEDAREQLWAKLNAAVDKQVEDVIKG